ncbi:Uma2 family endonuclease [Chloroflexales bacterium ZM16-3]|nr:Uma2 family endonuclease [Chloroflexales bacterium ZM16-3]
MAVEIRSAELMIIHKANGIEVALDDLQGLWTEEQYLKLTDQTNHLIEFTDGFIEFPPMPTDNHQTILAFLFELLLMFVRPQGGKVLFAPLRLQIRPGKQREPDILLVRDAGDPRRQNRYWLGADLVVEVVSPDDVERDTVEKVADYAEAGIPEYWIVNPEDESITVLRLEGEAYAALGVFRRGAVARSALLEGFAVSVDAVMDAS